MGYHKGVREVEIEAWGQAVENCSTCKWWRHDPDDDKDGWGRCELASSDEAKAEHPQSKAVAYDSGAWSAWLRTSPDFGCNQWSEG